METAANISVDRNRISPVSFRLKNAVIRKEPVIFLVDDDPLYLQALELAISSEIGTAKIHTFRTAAACINSLQMKPDVVILDYYLDSVYADDARNGIDVLKEIRKKNPSAKVIMLSAQDSLNIAIDCMENGAYDYISKSQSSFIRVNNLLTNILGDKENSSLFFRVMQVILLIILLVLIAGALINH
jgi:two-component system OmpR family response regulator